MVLKGSAIRIAMGYWSQRIETFAEINTSAGQENARENGVLVF